MSISALDTGAAIRKAFVENDQTIDTFRNPATGDIQVWQVFPASAAIAFPVAVYAQVEVEPAGEDADGRASVYSREIWRIDIYQREDPEGIISVVVGGFDAVAAVRTSGVIDAIGPLIGGTFVYVGQVPAPSPDDDVQVTSLMFRAVRLLA